MKIYGNIQDLSSTESSRLKELYNKKVPIHEVSTQEVTRVLVEVSHKTGRQIGILVDRKGIIRFVVVGDATKIMLPDIGRARAAQGRLRGLRLIHTHLRNEELTRDDIVDLTRLRLDMVIAICLFPFEARPLCVYYAHNVPVKEGQNEEPYRSYGPIPFAKVDVDPGEIIQALEEEFARAKQVTKTQAKDGRAIIVHCLPREKAKDIDEFLAEMKELARTAGVEVADTLIQYRDKPDPRYVIGKGKLESLIIRAMQLDVEVLIFSDNLSPTQATMIAKTTELKVIDRTQLILDIFAQHAESKDGKLQVELAQMKYLLPRLGAKDDALSRLTGGIGGRGPGETKLEIGRRRARERVARLQAQLKKTSKQREQRRGKRYRHNMPLISIIGYTNAGKSTLLNTLTGSDVIAENKLFATLDTRTRRLWIPRGFSGYEVLISDTVGFIRELPEDLFTAFRATFEEARDADLLLQVVDASSPNLKEHMEVTESLLVELGLEEIPKIIVYNKSDQITPETLKSLCDEQEGVGVSALQKATTKELILEVDKLLNSG
jgi:GTP-binding protein HflX